MFTIDNLDNLDENAVLMFYFLGLEAIVYIAILLSNIILMAYRTCFRAKIKIEQVTEDMKLPDVDTIAASS